MKDEMTIRDDLKELLTQRQKCYDDWVYCEINQKALIKELDIKIEVYKDVLGNE